jgi:hypothetical protein
MSENGVHHSLQTFLDAGCDLTEDGIWVERLAEVVYLDLPVTPPRERAKRAAAARARAMDLSCPRGGRGGRRRRRHLEEQRQERSRYWHWVADLYEAPELAQRVVEALPVDVVDTFEGIRTSSAGPIRSPSESRKRGGAATRAVRRLMRARRLPSPSPTERTSPTWRRPSTTAPSASPWPPRPSSRRRDGGPQPRAANAPSLSTWLDEGLADDETAERFKASLSRGDLGGVLGPHHGSSRAATVTELARQTPSPAATPEEAPTEPAKKGPTLDSLGDAYLWERRQRHEITPLSARKIRCSLRSFAKVFGARPVKNLSQRDVERRLETRSGLSAATRRSDLSDVRSFCQWLVRRRLYGSIQPPRSPP